jgi:hypothetical protein
VWADVILPNRNRHAPARGLQRIRF